MAKTHQRESLNSGQEWLTRNLNAILIFFDGTWSDKSGEDGEGLTANIYKLFSSLECEPNVSCLPYRKKLKSI